ncbi:MAG: hypothetical protein ACJ72M_16060, partial [Propionibacteriaceae bacterium]
GCPTHLITVGKINQGTDQLEELGLVVVDPMRQQHHPDLMITTQWCVRFPESTPAHTAGIHRPFASWSLAITLSIATPARPYPTIGVASLNQRSSYRWGGERPFVRVRPHMSLLVRPDM